MYMSLLSSHLRAIIALGHQWKIGGESALAVTLLILVFGLVVAGILAGVLVKIISARREGVTIDLPESNLIDDHYQHEWREDQRQTDSSMIAARKDRLMVNENLTAPITS
jgi:hypothetical protein